MPSINRTLLTLCTLLLAGCAAQSQNAPKASAIDAGPPESTADQAAPADKADAEVDVARTKVTRTEAGAAAPAVVAPASKRPVRNIEVMEPAPASTADQPLEARSEGGGGWFEGDTFEDDPSPTEEVDRLAEQIRGFRTAQTGAADRGAKAAPSSCGDVCDLSEAICTSSRKICKIATTNPTEGYFGRRCDWSRKECGSADERCVRCAN